MKIRTVPSKPYDLDQKSRVANKALRMVRRTPFMPSAGNFNVTISESHRFMWFRVAKVATRSILASLESTNVELDAEHPMEVCYPVNQYRDYFKFAFVRNPWDRLVSCWFNKIIDREVPPEPGVVRWDQMGSETLKRLSDFHNFVDYVETLDVDTCDIHLRSQSRLVDLNHIDYLGRFERLDADIGVIFEHLRLPCSELGTKNQSQGRKGYHAYYDDGLARRVGHIYRRDVQIFGYEFDDGLDT